MLNFSKNNSITRTFDNEYIKITCWNGNRVFNIPYN